MADIRVERSKGGHAWLWIVLAVVLLIAAAVLLHRAGYINLPIGTGASLTSSPPAELAAVGGTLHQEV